MIPFLSGPYPAERLLVDAVPPSAMAYPFFPSSPALCPPSARPGASIFVIDALQRSCSVFLPPLPAIYGIVGSHLPHYHTNSLTRTQPSSCALVTYGSRVTNPRALRSTSGRSEGPTAGRTG